MSRCQRRIQFSHQYDCLNLGFIKFYFNQLRSGEETLLMKEDETIKKKKTMGFLFRCIRYIKKYSYEPD